VVPVGTAETEHEAAILARAYRKIRASHERGLRRRTRSHHPTPIGITRRPPSGGATVSGQFPIDHLVRIAFASRNAGKLRELRALLPGWDIELLDTSGVEETGTTFYENALLKALHARRSGPPDAWALGEDSGLEVDGLGGRPGVFSARYAGDGASDEENLDRLLNDLAGVAGPGRMARYVCELVLLSPQGTEVRGTGTLEGAIGRERRGSGGFGYDPVFVPAGEARTVGELGDSWKAGASHRAAAVRALLASLRAREGG
jgi:XTP/dITP diphosphohydrolase